MTKSELIDKIASETFGVPRQDIETIVDTIFDTMAVALASHRRIEIRGLGSFCAKARRPRPARNPRTGEEVFVPARWVPFFIAGKELRDRLNAVASLLPNT